MNTNRETCAKLLSLAVHEFRTPVTVVSGYARMLLREQVGPLSDRQRPLVEQVEKSCGRLAQLVAELSELSNLHGNDIALDRKPVEWTTLVEEVAANVHEGEDRGVRLEVQGGSGRMTVLADADRVRRALQSIFTAILREQADPTTVVARCSRREQDGHRMACVVVAEASSIAGLSESHPPAWGAFDEWRGGVGLTLPIARAVIEAHGGHLASPPGKASREAILVALPAEEKQA